MFRKITLQNREENSSSKIIQKILLFLSTMDEHSEGR